MGTYERDRQWCDQMIPQIKAIVGRHLLEAADFELDAKQATDLIVFTARDIRVAARVRRPGYAYRYAHEFTIRAARSSGVETELSKIVNGWGDALFYGHADSAGEIVLWHLICLHAFRAALIRHSINRQPIRWSERSNGDGTTFKAFDLRSFQKNPPILIASSNPPSHDAAHGQSIAAAG